MSRLEGAALKWIQPTILASRSSPQVALKSLDAFMMSFDRAFKDSYEVKKATDKLLDLRQGNRSALDHYTEFVNLLCSSAIDMSSAVAIFERDLSAEIRDRMVDKNYTTEFDVFAEQGLALDSRLASNKHHGRPSVPPLPPSASPGYFRMQVDGIN